MMDRVKQAVHQTHDMVALPPKWLQKYDDLITKNAGAVGQIEGALRSLTYILPGRFRESEVASESVNAGVQLLSLYHDCLLSRSAAQSPRSTKLYQPPHNRYTRFYFQQSPTYRRTAIMLQVVQYTELLLEMAASRRGEQARWRLVILLESIKAICRLLLMRLTNSRPLLSPPVPEREPMDPIRSFEDPTESTLSNPDSRWKMPRTSLTLPSLPAADDIPAYLRSRVLAADDIRPPQALLHRVSGLGGAAETVYILRPVFYALAMAYWSRHGRKAAKTDWRPWLIGLAIEFGARQLAKYELEKRRPGGKRSLTQLEREEFQRRGRALWWWTMRGAFYENFTKGMLMAVATKLKKWPLLDLVGGIVEDYDFLWDQYYFPTATL
ncbi:peroxisomal membrane protein pex16 [Piedraia hortae CBS 480.64]|uniref:Peroxisomal membrane protein PEX16 n=1 Tax=Piedraia hortae CBS 480.64 TaxID=1314780 RepID=A0A6A7C138_9PEZI|nr:peroxisomal membrane protein pex16 [Piedraia hortae CBS 480.64]